MERKPTWKALVADVLADLPREFTLQDVVARREIFAQAYPSNRFIDAKIRQTLQILRDQEMLEFLGHGRYRKRASEPGAMSLRIDPELARQYKSAGHFGRVVIETWAEMNLYCVNCSADGLLRLPHNTPLADLECQVCELRYQLKSTKGRFASVILGAAHRPLLDAIRADMVPAYVLVEYDLRFASLVYVRAVPGQFITEDRVKARRRLSEKARRAGWLGCTVDIAGLPDVRIVEPSAISKQDVRSTWRDLVSTS